MKAITTTTILLVRELRQREVELEHREGIFIHQWVLYIYQGCSFTHSRILFLCWVPCIRHCARVGLEWSKWKQRQSRHERKRKARSVMEELGARGKKTVASKSAEKIWPWLARPHCIWGLRGRAALWEDDNTLEDEGDTIPRRWAPGTSYCYPRITEVECVR